MPKLDRYGSQPPVELLRQFQDFGGVYDREKLFWKQIKDVTICAACAPPGGGRNPVTPRMIRHFSMFCLPTPSDISLKGIFSVSKVLVLGINILLSILTIRQSQEASLWIFLNQ